MSTVTKTRSSPDLNPQNEFILSSSPSDENPISSSPTFSKLSQHHTLDRQPVRLRKVKKHSASSTDLKSRPVPYNRSNSEMSFSHLPSIKKQMHNAEGDLLFHELLFSSIKTKIYFNEEKAAHQLIKCYKQFPQSREVLIQKMIEIRNDLVSAKHLKRVDVVITKILSHKGYGHFIWRYFTSSEQSLEEVGRFATNAITTLTHQNESSIRILAIDLFQN